MNSSLNCALIGRVAKLRGIGPNEAVERLRQGLRELTGERPSVEQMLAWQGSWLHIQGLLQRLNDDLWVAFEYRLPISHQRIDMLLFGRDRHSHPTAVVIELKGWSTASEKSHGIVEADGKRFQHPDIQTTDYVNKLRFSHSEAHKYRVEGITWLYNLSPSCLHFRWAMPFFHGQDDELADYLRALLPAGLPWDEVEAFLKGTYVQTAHLLDAVEKHKNELLRGAIEALSTKGCAPSEEQQEIIAQVLETLQNDNPATFLIAGEPGSGKSYLAILLLIKALSGARSLGGSQGFAVLGLRNNRLLNTVRQVFRRICPGLDTAVRFYSTGRGFGLAEAKYRGPNFRLAIFDEAQRFAQNLVENAIRRSMVSVFLYDETQILNLDEGGTTDAFKQAANRLGRQTYHFTLKGIYRVQGGREYHRFVETLLNDPTQLSSPLSLPNYEFRVFDDIEDMIDALKAKVSDQTQVALVAAFTESPGDRENKTAKSILNLRVGYPLYSGWDHYRGKNLQIYWLMDEETQYPQFWYGRESNHLTHCASIYGCQGFEADYVGVIWGRDFVWRNGRWSIGSNCEDTIGRPPLKELVNKRDPRAIPLLVNRYRIFLTRGIQGTYVYCEDEETACLLREIARLVK